MTETGAPACPSQAAASLMRPVNPPSKGEIQQTGKVELSIGADSTVWRTDVANQSYRGTVKVSF